MLLALRAVIACAVTGWLFAAPAAAQSQQSVEIPTRAGHTVRAILIRPGGTLNGSLILLPGGHGNLTIGKDGSIAWGKGLHLVRARMDYAKAGFAVLLPDIAHDMKKGEDAQPNYRSSVAHAMDIGSLVAYMRRQSSPVVLVGGDRGSISAANAATRLGGNERPDAIVFVGGTLMGASPKQPGVEKSVPGLQRITQPALIVAHEKDACRHSKPEAASLFQRQLSGSRRADVKLVSGGNPGGGDPCGAHTHHEFLGMDGDVVRQIADWVKSIPKS